MFKSKLFIMFMFLFKQCQFSDITPNCFRTGNNQFIIYTGNEARS